jgi:hypothetical protein
VRLFASERQSLGADLVTITRALGHVAAGCTVVLPSRLRLLARALGIETVMRSHRALGRPPRRSTPRPDASPLEGRASRQQPRTFPTIS